MLGFNDMIFCDIILGSTQFDCKYKIILNYAGWECKVYFGKYILEC